ncbi:hypothetical protein DVT68_15285 [Dyella solisilvae]|uniref:CENP-V/GFA domain-containing protein n=1 Tax=Dyella solisilvae TaxID=1920168 RepID=A0A370K6K8_9GAMM|nr:hypothetical protein [Dyella solisilvae]RDI97650.1 hypothetical protein DVT68_15285 [Dyella solisilvae]
MLIHGKCHCGNIRFTLAWASDPTAIPARACDCSFCTKHGAAWTSDPDARLQVVVDDAAAVSHYAFGTGSSDFHVCMRCGVVPLVTCRVDGVLYAVVNVRAFDDVDPALLQHVSASFSNEGLEARLARRKSRWIGDVTFA